MTGRTCARTLQNQESKLNTRVQSYGTCTATLNTGIYTVVRVALRTRCTKMVFSELVGSLETKMLVYDTSQALRKLLLLREIRN